MLLISSHCCDVLSSGPHVWLPEVSRDITASDNNIKSIKTATTQHEVFHGSTRKWPKSKFHFPFHPVSILYFGMWEPLNCSVNGICEHLIILLWQNVIDTCGGWRIIRLVQGESPIIASQHHTSSLMQGILTSKQQKNIKSKKKDVERCQIKLLNLGMTSEEWITILIDLHRHTENTKWWQT